MNPERWDCIRKKEQKKAKTGGAMWLRV